MYFFQPPPAPAINPMPNGMPASLPSAAPTAMFNNIHSTAAVPPVNYGPAATLPPPMPAANPMFSGPTTGAIPLGKII